MIGRIGKIGRMTWDRVGCDGIHTYIYIYVCTHPQRRRDGEIERCKQLLT